MKRIVVGVDGSETSRRALAWAMTEARAHGGAVEAIMVVPDPVALWAAMPEAMDYPVDESERRSADARAELDAIVDEVAGGETSVHVNALVEEGPAASTLLRRSQGADLLVLGSRGFGGFRGLLLGSVSHQCASHAPCPVVVIPPRHEGA